MAFAPSLAWLFVGRLISGATSGVFSTANAYVADVTAPENRARAFGWMGSAFTVGFLPGLRSAVSWAITICACLSWRRHCSP
jgi:DHA1 family tetracycline resistance protein-like MFS transporter